MSKISLSELLKQDIKDLKGLLNYEKYGLTEELMKTQTKAIILNLQDHLTTIAQDDGQDSSSLSEKILNLFFGRVPSEGQEINPFIPKQKQSYDFSQLCSFIFDLKLVPVKN